MGLDELIDGDSRSTRNDSPSEPGSTQSLKLEPTEALSTPERIEAEAGLLYGLLAAAGGLVMPEALTRSLGAWARSPGRSLRELLVARGHLSESDASLIDALASASLGRHGGSAREALVALGDTARFRIEPDEVAHPGLRHLLAGLVEGHVAGPDADGFGQRYEVIRQHARGGLGVVSLARDREIHREVAIKEIRTDYADDPDTQARFRREAEVTGRLEHPGIVPVYGIGYHDDGRPYYIMRFIRGETLKVAIARLHKSGDEDEAGPEGRGDLHSLVGRFIDACHAVAYAHHRKILHRDLKPINIMLGPFGETLVVDWGLAKSFDGSRSGSYPVEVDEQTLRPQSGSGMTPTRHGSEVGTIGYMSPEQAEGRLAELGPTSDIYSLGVTLVILGTGHSPFEGLGRDEFLRRVRQGEFPRPSRLNPTIPPALEAICLKAMALRPIDRYQTVGELIDDLERWRAGHPVLAYPEPFVDRLSRWAKRHRTALAGAAVLLVCATVGLAVFAEQKREENLKIKAERAEAGRQRDAAEANLRFSLGLLKSTLKTVAGADLAFLAREESFWAAMADRLLESHRELSRSYPDDKSLRFDLAQSCQLAANTGRLMGKTDKPRGLYTEAIQLLESLDDWNPEDQDVRVELATIRGDAGENLRMLGKPDEASGEIRPGLAALQRPTDRPIHPIVLKRTEARLRLGLAAALVETGHLDPARKEYQRVVDVLTPLDDEASAKRIDHLMLIHALLGLGEIFRISGEFDHASTAMADAARRARELMSVAFDLDTRFTFAAVRNAQGFLLLQSRSDGPKPSPLTAFEDALGQLLPLYNDMPRMIHLQRGIAGILIGRASCFVTLNKPEAAASDLDAVLKLLDQLDSAVPGHFSDQSLRGQAYAVLSRLSRAQGKADAGEFLLKAIACHSAALKAVPGSRDDLRLREECRRDLARLEEKVAPNSARP